MAVTVGRLLVTLEAQTAAFDARMTAAGQQLNRWNSAAGGAHRGTALLRAGLQSLAIDGLGAIPAPLARVLAGFGSLALGSTVAIGVLAFFSISKKLMDLQTEAAEKFAKRLEDLRRQFIQLGDRAGIGGLRLQIMDVNAPKDQQTTEALKKRSDELVKTILLLQRYGAAAPGGAPGVQFYVRELTGVQTELTFRKGITEELEKQIRLLERKQREEKQHAEAMRFHKLFPDVYAGPFGGLASSYAASLGTGAPPLLGPGRPIGQVYGPFGGLATSAQAALGSRGKPGQGFELTPQAMSMLLMSLMAMQGGGSQGALMGLGGLATGVSSLHGVGAAAGPLGWIGFGISALATLFGSKADEKERNDQRRHQELIGVLHEGPARISQYFEGDPEASLYQNRRLERLGGEPRNGGL